MIDTGLGGLDLIDLSVKLVIVLVLLLVTLRVLGRMQAVAPRRQGRLQVLESRSLASKASLHLVAVGDRRLVVGLTPSGMVSLAELTKDELEAGDFALEMAAQEASASASLSAPGSTAGLPARPLFPAGSPLNTLVRPIDAFADRLASAINGARAR
jgi:flagellar biosynthetic protein FliO